MCMLRHKAIVIVFLTLISGCASVTATSRATHRGDNSAVVAKIPLGGNPTDVALLPDGSRAYVTAAGQVFVIDTRTASVAGSVSVSGHPAGIGLSADGARAYVADQFSATVSVLDTAASQIVDTIEVGPTSTTTTVPVVVVARDGSVAYVTDPGNDLLLVIDTEQRFVRARVALHLHPAGAALSPDGKFVYVSGCAGACTGGMIAVVDTHTFVISDSIPTVRPLGRIALNADGTRAYISDGAELLIVDTNTNSVGLQVPGDFGPEIAAAPNGSAMYVHGDHMSIFDIGSNGLVATIPLPADVTRFALSPDAQLAYFVAGDRLYVVDARPPYLKSAR